MKRTMKRISIFLLVLSTSFCLEMALRAADQDVSVPWLKLDERVYKDWRLIHNEKEADSCEIITRIPSKEKKIFKVFVYFPKASSAYNTSLATILNIFEIKDVSAHFYLKLKTKRTTKEDILSKFKIQYGGAPFDLILSMGSSSTSFFHKNYRHLDGSGIPVVTVCSKDPVLMGQVKTYDEGSGSNIAYTSLNTDELLQFRYLKLLKPSLRCIAVLVESTNLSAIKTQVEPLEKLAQKNGVFVFRISVKKSADIALEVEKESSRIRREMRWVDPLLDNSLFWISGSSALFPEKVIAAINRGAGKIPVLSTVPNVIRSGENSAAISIGVGFENNAAMAARYSLEILNNRVKPGDLPVGRITPPDLAINFLRTRKCGLKVPFTFFETAVTVYDCEGRPFRLNGKTLDK